MPNHPPAAPSTKERNEYIPSFISKKPFYIPSDLSDADYLEHQRLQKETPQDSKWYSRGSKLGPASTKYRKGACENCGAMTHKTKECLSRPRKQGAKWTGRDIQADERVEKVELGWDAKRDRWNGYDPAEYSSVVREHEDLEALKRAARGDDNHKTISPDNDADNASDEDDKSIEEARYAEETEMGRTNQAPATRNLRLREDTAKYLLNLDLDSARYDPKTRSMVDSGATLSDNTSRLLAEENFARASGDAAEFEKAQRYAWESQEKKNIDGSVRQHLQANPTEGEISRKKETAAASDKRQRERAVLLAKYGSQPSNPIPDGASSSHQAIEASESYTEYDAHGLPKLPPNSAPKAKATSKYAEDIYPQNHTSVWGSWWSDFRWGYACCRSTVKNSYCTGEEGMRAWEESEGRRLGEDLGQEEESDAVEEQKEEDTRRTEQRIAPEEKDESSTKKKKRTLAAIQQGIDEEEMEAYKRSRAKADDPMARMLGRDELVT
ncbi:MAG: hypothetical protein Q9227_001644 [Pyrenula ochraceoflavens]